MEFFLAIFPLNHRQMAQNIRSVRKTTQTDFVIELKMYRKKEINNYIENYHSTLLNWRAQFFK